MALSVLKRFVFNRDQYRCLYCGRPVETINYSAPYAATIDHVIPRGLGGRTRSTNLVTACFQCNHTRGNLTLEEWADRFYNGNKIRAAALIDRVMDAINEPYRRQDTET